MSEPSTVDVLGQGRFLRLVRRNGWEFVERTKQVKAAFIGAVTDAGALIVTAEFRVPLGKICVGCPAGLIGDEEGSETEVVEVAVKRELIEEAGYAAERVTILTAGPTSAGLTDEIITIVLAEGLKKVGPGGGIGGENIVVHEVPLAEVHDWLEARVRAGDVVDAKIYTVLYFIQRLRQK